MDRYLLQGTYRIYFNADNEESALSYASAFGDRIQSINDGALETEVQTDGGLTKVSDDPHTHNYQTRMF